MKHVAPAVFVSAVAAVLTLGVAVAQAVPMGRGAAIRVPTAGHSATNVGLVVGKVRGQSPWRCCPRPAPSRPLPARVCRGAPATPGRRGRPGTHRPAPGPRTPRAPSAGVPGDGATGVGRGDQVVVGDLIEVREHELAELRGAVQQREALAKRASSTRTEDGAAEQHVLRVVEAELLHRSPLPPWVRRYPAGQRSQRLTTREIAPTMSGGKGGKSRGRAHHRLRARGTQAGELGGRRAPLRRAHRARQHRGAPAAALGEGRRRRGRGEPGPGHVVPRWSGGRRPALRLRRALRGRRALVGTRVLGAGRLLRALPGLRYAGRARHRPLRFAHPLVRADG